MIGILMNGSNDVAFGILESSDESSLEVIDKSVGYFVENLHNLVALSIARILYHRTMPDLVVILHFSFNTLLPTLFLGHFSVSPRRELDYFFCALLLLSAA